MKEVAGSLLNPRTAAPFPHTPNLAEGKRGGAGQGVRFCVCRVRGSVGSVWGGGGGSVKVGIL